MKLISEGGFRLSSQRRCAGDGGRPSLRACKRGRSSGLVFVWIVCTLGSYVRNLSVFFPLLSRVPPPHHSGRIKCFIMKNTCGRERQFTLFKYPWAINLHNTLVLILGGGWEILTYVRLHRSLFEITRGELIIRGLCSVTVTFLCISPRIMKGEVFGIRNSWNTRVNV